MFLRELTEKNHNDFLVLAKEIIQADGVIADTEKAMMDQYFLELGVQPYHVEGALLDAVQNLSKLPLTLRKKLFFELVILSMGDGSYAQDERNILQRIASSWQIGDTEVAAIERVAEETVKVYHDIAELFR